MIFYIILCNILFIPLVFGANISTKVDQNSTAVNKESHVPEINKTEIVVSEGGSIIQKTPVATLPKENNTTFLGDAELLKEKSEPTNSKVVPRKGVQFSDNGTDSHQAKESNSTNQHQDFEYIPVVELNQNDTKKTTQSNKNYFKYKVEPSKNISSVHKNISETQVRKKPLVLSFDGLSNNDKSIQHDDLNIPAIKSSSNTLVHDQMPSPSKVSGPTTKILPMSSSRHPGMVMPVIITILVVPMFVFLGYMALRRGQEAWKNRHYKRMDFLLDGMYND